MATSKIIYAVHVKLRPQVAHFFLAPPVLLQASKGPWCPKASSSPIHREPHPMMIYPPSDVSTYIYLNSRTKEMSVSIGFQPLRCKYKAKCSRTLAFRKLLRHEI